jgi:ADP-ribosyl-[dinitrogen reductase] hydrolase
MFVFPPIIEVARAGIPAALSAQAEGAYLGLAVGDALGATTEFMTPREIRQAHGVHRTPERGRLAAAAAGPGHGRHRDEPGPGTRHPRRRRAWTQRAIAESFSAWMRGRPVDIGHTVRRGIVRYRQTGQTAMPLNDQDAGNGACMRALPIALCTLGLDGGRGGRGQPDPIPHHPSQPPRGCRDPDRDPHGPGQPCGAGTWPSSGYWRRPWWIGSPATATTASRLENPGGYLVETLQAVFQALFGAHDFETALIDVVNRGGDADTTGAILGMIAGALYGREAIPRRWLAALDPRIRMSCREQASALLRVAPKGRELGWDR